MPEFANRYLVPLLETDASGRYKHARAATPRDERGGPPRDQRVRGRVARRDPNREPTGLGVAKAAAQHRARHRVRARPRSELERLRPGPAAADPRPGGARAIRRRLDHGLARAERRRVDRLVLGLPVAQMARVRDAGPERVPVDTRGVVRRPRERGPAADADRARAPVVGPPAARPRARPSGVEGRAVLRDAGLALGARGVA